MCWGHGNDDRLRGNFERDLLENNWRNKMRLMRRIVRSETFAFYDKSSNIFCFVFLFAVRVFIVRRILNFAAVKIFLFLFHSFVDLGSGLPFWNNLRLVTLIATRGSLARRSEHIPQERNSGIKSVSLPMC